MKKAVLVSLLVVGALAVLAIGVAFAQTPQPPTPGGWPGMMGFGRGGMMNGQEGPMHEYMIKAMADAVGISADEFEKRREGGETAYEIALAEGIAADKIPALFSEARAKALDAAAAAGVITKDQADWMKSRGAGMMGQGGCGGSGQGFGPGMMGRGGGFWQDSD